MRIVATIVGLIAAGLAIVGGALVGGDRQTLVPPPDAVAESFTRALIQGSYDLTARHLSKARRASAHNGELRGWFDPVRRRLGKPNGVESALDVMDGSGASARATIDGQYGTAVLHLRLVREDGLWVVEEWSSDVAVATRE